MLQVCPSQSIVVFPVQGSLVAGTRLSGSIFCQSGRALRDDRAPHNGCKKGEVDKLWRKLFSDPSEWRDHRMDKTHPRFPDFKHKKTREGLWLNSKWIPEWVEEKLDAMPPGTLEASTFSRNRMLFRCVKAGQYEETMKLFQQMQRDVVKPDTFAFVSVLNACAGLGTLETGRRIHTQILQNGYEADLYVGTSLVDMYAKCGSIDDAREVFNQMPTRNVVAWNAMLAGYVKCGECQQALELFGQMQEEGVDPDRVTYVGVLNACARVEGLKEGRRFHEQIIQRGYESDVFVGNSLVDMYAKCGSIEEAHRVFNQMSTRDVVAWNALIAGYVKCVEGQQALELFAQMQSERVDPDQVTFVGVLNACASLAAIEEGRHTHQHVIQSGYDSNVFVMSSLIDMYAKCGSIEDARTVFSQMPTRNVVAWNAMLAGYGWHGYAKEALEHFKQMCEYVAADDITFISLLSACSHGGLVDEGLEVFKSMSEVYNMSPTALHYACVIDLLGRAGRLHEAEDIIRTMPMKANARVWINLLGSCRSHGNVDMGERIAKHVLELDPDHSAGYVLLSNIYAAAGRWDGSSSFKQEMLDRCGKETPSCKLRQILESIQN